MTMNAFRMQLLAASLVAAGLPALAAAATPPPAAGQAQAERAQAPQQELAETRAQNEKRLAEARARLEKATQEVAELSRQMGRDFTLRFNTAGAAPRSLLGVMIEPNEKKDGAQVREVSPGGAAAEAGIRAGDIITSIAGQDLSKESDPGRVLVERMGQIEPNLKVQVGVLREGRKLSFDVTPRPAPAPQVSGATGVGQEGPRIVQRILQERLGDERGRQGVAGGPWAGVAGPGERSIDIRMLRDGGPDDGTRFAGLEFASLSEKLGGYFGVKSGVLVVRAGANSPMKLQDGDVILDIDGREPSSAQHAARILRSYSPGEKLTLRVQRDRKAQNVAVTMPHDNREDLLIRAP
jgi:C-terminal processing protease CtpA/Prc